MGNAALPNGGPIPPHPPARHRGTDQLSNLVLLEQTRLRVRSQGLFVVVKSASPERLWPVPSLSKLLVAPARFSV